MRVEAVVMDIGQVLIDWRPQRYYDRLIGPERCAAYFAEVDLFGMMDRIDAGADFSATVNETIEAHPEWRGELIIWRDNWAEILGPAIDDSQRLLKALKAKGIPVFALSNFGAQNYDMSMAKFPVLREFDRQYISGKMKLMKPDPAIYAAVEADCGLAPGSLLFTDDRPENIEAARERGWQVHLFDGPTGWAQCLAQSGLLSEEEAK